MMKHHREGFLRFLSRVNQPSKNPFVSKETLIQWLEADVGKGLPEIEREWRDFIDQMT